MGGGHITSLLSSRTNSRIWVNRYVCRSRESPGVGRISGMSAKAQKASRLTSRFRCSSTSARDIFTKTQSGCWCDILKWANFSMPGRRLNAGLRKVCQSYVLTRVEPSSLPTSCGMLTWLTAVLSRTTSHKSSRLSAGHLGSPETSLAGQRPSRGQTLYARLA